MLYFVEVLVLMILVGPVVSEAEGEGAPLTPQTPKVEAGNPVELLEELLGRLQQIDPKTWDARIQALEAEIENHKKEAASLRRRAKKLAADAKKEEGKSENLRAEIERMRVMKELLTKMRETKASAIPKKPQPKPKAVSSKTMTPKPTQKKLKKVARGYEEHVLPIFEESCLACHAEDGARGGLDLSTYSTMREGGGSGEVITPGDPDQSRLFRLITHQEKPHMPPRQPKISGDKIGIIREWIEQGAPLDAGSAKLSDGSEEEAVKPQGPTPPQFTGPPPMPSKVDATTALLLHRPPVVTTLAASPRAPLLAVPGHRQVVLYSTETEQPLIALPFEPGDVEVLDFTVDGTRLLAAGGVSGKSGAAVLYDITRGEVLGHFGKERDKVLAAAISPGQSLVALAGAAKKVRVYATNTADLLYEIDQHNDWVLSLHVSGDGNYLASADRSGRVSMWEADTGRHVHDFSGHVGAVHRVRFRPDAGLLASAGEDGTVRLWELEDGKQVRKIDAHQSSVQSLAWSRDHHLVTCGQDGVVKVWGQDGKSLLSGFPPVPEWIYSVCVDAKAETVFFGDWTGSVVKGELSSGRILSRLGLPEQP